MALCHVAEGGPEMAVPDVNIPDKGPQIAVKDVNIPKELVLFFGCHMIDSAHENAMNCMFTPTTRKTAYRRSSAVKRRAHKLALSLRRSTRFLLARTDKIGNVPPLRVGDTWSTWANQDLNGYVDERARFESARTAAVKDGRDADRLMLKEELTESLQQYIQALKKDCKSVLKKNNRFKLRRVEEEQTSA